MRDVDYSTDFKKSFNCHFEPDWVLIYKLTDELLTLAATGTHSDIFG